MVVKILSCITNTIVADNMVVIFLLQSVRNYVRKGSYACSPGWGLLKLRSLNELSKIFDFVKVLARFFESDLYMIGATAGVLRRHPSNIHVISI